MALPPAVKRQAEKAKAIAAQRATLKEAAQRGQPAPQAPVVQDTTNVPAQPPVNGVGNEAVQVQEDAPGGMESGKVPMDDYKTRFENLRTSRNKDKVRVAELEQENARLQAAAKAAEQAAAPSPLQLSDEERASMSEEEIKAHERLAGKLKDVLPTPAPVEQVPMGPSQEELEVNFFTDLESIVPNWAEINTSQGFISWLAQPDGFSGRTRQETLGNARAALDANTVTTLFGAYAAEMGQLAASNANGNNVVGNQPVVTSVEPTRGSAQASPLSGGEGIVILRNADVQEFYRQKNQLIRRKKMVGAVKEQFDAQESEIRKAHAEGRIR